MQVTKIEVEFSKGSFSEWANTMEDQPEADIARWESAYNKQIANAIKETYPNAEVEVGEGYDQLMNTKVYAVLEEVEANEDYQDDNADEDVYAMQLEDDVKLQVDHIIGSVADNGQFWGA